MHKMAMYIIKHVHIALNMVLGPLTLNQLVSLTAVNCKKLPLTTNHAAFT